MNPTREATGQTGAHSTQGASSSRPLGWGGEETTAWTGWVVFAGIVMVMMGTFHAIQGLVGLFNSTVFLVRHTGLVVSLDYSTWGWIHLGLGILVVFAGVALLAGQLWARFVAVILAFLSAMVNVSFMAAYPLWSLLIIALDVVVIWAVTVHGDELKA